MWALIKVAMLAVVMLWAGFRLQRSAAAGHKIVVIADPHLIAPELLTNPGNADWTTLPYRQPDSDIEIVAKMNMDYELH